MAIHKFDNEMSHLELKNHDIIIGTFIDEFDERIIAFVNECNNITDKERKKKYSFIGISIHVKLKKLLSLPCYVNRLAGQKDDYVMNIKSKPVFDQTRQILVDLIAKIDNLKFKHPAKFKSPTE